MGRWDDGTMGRWGDGTMGRWGDGAKFLENCNISVEQFSLFEDFELFLIQNITHVN